MDTRAGFETVLVAPPYPPITRLGPNVYVPTVEDRRIRFANELEQRHLPMLRRLKREQIGNFGGIEWLWSNGPENDGLGTVRGIAYFLRGPVASLARYTSNPLFSAARGSFSRSDQDRIAPEWARRIGPDSASAGFGNMSVPWLNISMPRAEFEARRRAEGWDIPVNLRLRFDPRAEPDLPAVSEEASAAVRFFPHQTTLSGPVPDIATFDTVVLRDGCFFIDEEGDDDPLVLFPLGIGLYRDETGHLAFRPRYSFDARRFARVGTRMQLGPRPAIANPPAELARACGNHRVVAVTSVNQAAGYGGAWFDVQQYRDRVGISSVEAMRRANECLLTRERRMAAMRLRGEFAPIGGCEDMTITIPPPPPPAALPAPASEAAN